MGSMHEPTNISRRYAVKLWVPIKRGANREAKKGTQGVTGKRITPTVNRFEVFEEAEQDWETFDADFRRRV